MSMAGVTVKVQATDVTEEQLENIYISLTNNFAIKSVDMGFDEQGQSFSFLFGVEAPDGLDSEELMLGIVDDALDRAFADAASGNSHMTSRESVLC